jgi:hypothetical protein
MPKTGKVTLSYTTSGGVVGVSVTSASAAVTVTVKDPAGVTVASGSGGAGLALSAVLPGGAFSVVVQGTVRTKYAISVSRPS